VSKHRVFTRAVLVLCVIAVVYYNSSRTKESILAKQSGVYERRAHDVLCSESYTQEIQKYKGMVVHV
jgi:hypothetical protein